MDYCLLCSSSLVDAGAGEGVFLVFQQPTPIHGAAEKKCRFGV